MTIFFYFFSQKTIVPFLQEVFMPIVTTIFTVLGQPVDSLDTQATRDKQMLQRSYFQFLQTITMHDVMEVIANQGEYYGMEFRFYMHVT